MKVRYILMYGTPYLKHEHFENFSDMSNFLVRKGIVDYRIYEIMDDTKEVEMIYLENDVKVLETENQQLKSNWNELKEWLEENESLDDYCNETTFTSVLDKMEELEKESDVK